MQFVSRLGFADTSLRSLLAAVETARSSLRTAGAAVHCDLNSPKLPATHEGVLALREAVTNVIRHVGASSCSLSIRQVNGSCRMEIADNGHEKLAPKGVALSGMRTRVEVCGGKPAARGEQLKRCQNLVSPD